MMSDSGSSCFVLPPEGLPHCGSGKKPSGNAWPRIVSWGELNG